MLCELNGFQPKFPELGQKPVAINIRCSLCAFVNMEISRFRIHRVAWPRLRGEFNKEIWSILFKY
jgi:hypothetical protein